MNVKRLVSFNNVKQKESKMKASTDYVLSKNTTRLHTTKCSGMESTGISHNAI